MITSGTFGVAGRLGNQVFQLGLLFGVAARNGYRFGLRRGGEVLWECFDLEIDEPSGHALTGTFEESGGTCNFDDRVFAQPDGTVFYGFYQSYRYHEHCRPALLSFLRFHPRHREAAEREAARLRGIHRGCPLVSVHYRRTDYLETTAVDRWGNLDADGFYDRAFANIGDDATYVVFSDDAAWCRQHVRRRNAEFVELDVHASLCLMSLCDVNVVANSSFSWWGAFLNRNGARVYAPARWYGRAMGPPNDRQQDIVPPAWVKISAFGAEAPALPAAPASARIVKGATSMMECEDDGRREDPYATHRPVLRTLLEMTEGPILELGGGNGSTPMIHRLARGRPIVTLESDPDWRAELASRFEGTLHQFVAVDDWARILASPFLDRRWGLIFVDQSPWAARFQSILALRERADYVILHDSDYFPGAGVFGRVIRPIVPFDDPGERSYGDVFKFWREYFPEKPWPGGTGPPTLLASQHHPCDVAVPGAVPVTSTPP